MLSAGAPSRALITGSSAFAQKKAVAYGLTGWVRNTADGKVRAMLKRRLTLAALMASQVEGEAQGAEDALQKLLGDLGRGPAMAHVYKVEKHEKEVDQGESGFGIS